MKATCYGLLLLLSSLLSLSLGGPICAQTTCSASRFLDDISMLVCASFDGSSGNVKISPCPKGYECDVTLSMLAVGSGETFESYCRPLPIQERKKKIPGEDCYGDYECYSENCSAGKCRGKELGEDCVTSSEGNRSEKLSALLCDSNLLCDHDSLTCQPGKKYGETCEKHSDCDGLGVCISGTCSGIGDLTEGRQCVSSMQCSDNLFCNAGVCAQAGHYRKSGYNEVCQSDSECYPARCECRMPNPQGFGLCGALKPGDFGREYLNWQRRSYKKSTFKCPLDFKDRPFAMSCWPQTPEKFAGLTIDSCYDDFPASGVSSLKKSADYKERKPTQQWWTFISTIVNFFD